MPGIQYAKPVFYPTAMVLSLFGRRGMVLELIFVVCLFSDSMETSEDNSKEQALVAEQESNDAVSHTCGDPQSISENKMVETLTACIK